MLRAAIACVLLMLAGCAGGQLLPEAGSPAPGSMNGRWVLSERNAPSCGMTFAGSPGALSGTISPEGGCPGRFFLGRRWTLGENGLTISDEDMNTLGTLTFSGGRFAGTSAAGTPVTLTR